MYNGDRNTCNSVKETYGDRVIEAHKAIHESITSEYPNYKINKFDEFSTAAIKRLIKFLGSKSDDNIKRLISFLGDIGLKEGPSDVVNGTKEKFDFVKVLCKVGELER